MKPLPTVRALPSSEIDVRDGDIIEKLREHGGPMVLTRDGKPGAIVMSPEEFERLTQAARFVAAVSEGLADSEAGRLVSDEELGYELERALGAPLP
jgi:PHD/YefM family antitoxin component YafN of YafNO toxin-antitoxin module